MRLRVLWLMFSVACLVLLGGLWRLQMGQGAHFYVLSEENRMKLIPLAAPRGRIFDRNMNVLVDSRPAFNVMFIPEELKKHPLAIVRLSKILDCSAKSIWQEIKSRKRPGFLPLAFRRDVSLSMVAQVEEQNLHLPGVYVAVEPRRQYRMGDFASHLIGYVGQINRKELDRLKVHGYGPKDLIGKDGVELSFDRYLKGQKGGVHMEVTASGRQRQILGQKDPVKGNDLVLTIDSHMQQAVEEAFEGRKGAVVIMDPASGDILAMSSKPSYDPDVFVSSARLSELKEVLADNKRRPLINRSIHGSYPPGSIFKPIVGLAGLQENKSTYNTSVFCDGTYDLGRIFHCWERSGHGHQNFVNSLAHSCNIYYYRLGVALGVNKLAKYAKLFGLGQRTGIDLAGEKEGLVPTARWKRKVFKERWYKGETANYSIGQGYMLTTPLQLARAVTALSNGGYLFTPRIVKKIVRSDGQEFEPALPRAQRIKAKPQHWNAVREGMRMVVNSPSGSGRRAKVSGVTIAGKTGTAQVASKSQLEKFGQNIPEKYRNHAWFASFAPYENPRLSMVVFLEHGQSGGQNAAVVAQDILQRIFI